MKTIRLDEIAALNPAPNLLLNLVANGKMSIQEYLAELERQLGVVSHSGPNNTWVINTNQALKDPSGDFLSREQYTLVTKMLCPTALQSLRRDIIMRGPVMNTGSAVISAQTNLSANSLKIDILDRATGLTTPIDIPRYTPDTVKFKNPRNDDHVAKRESQSSYIEVPSCNFKYWWRHRKPRFNVFAELQLTHIPVTKDKAQLYDPTTHTYGWCYDVSLLEDVFH